MHVEEKEEKNYLFPMKEIIKDNYSSIYILKSSKEDFFLPKESNFVLKLSMLPER